MFEDKVMKIIGRLMVLGLVVYVIILLLDDKWQLNYFTEPKQAYITAEVDSTVVRQLNPIDTVEAADTIYVPPTLSALVAKVDSDSVRRYDLHRDLQEVVTIDMEEHEEKVFFTLEDMKAYFQWVVEKYEKIKNK